MHLFALQTFSDRFGVDLNTADFLDAVTQASQAATQDIVSRFRLGGIGTYATRRDYFFVDNMSRQGTANVAEFYLSRPFVYGAVTALYMPSPVEVRNGNADGYTDISNTSGNGDSNYGALDAERGIYHVFGLNLSGQWVTVEYSGGLDLNSAMEYEGVPDWLQEVAMAQAALNLSGHVMFQTEDEGNDLSELRPQISRAVNDYAKMALAPSAYKPRFSDVV
jgi:hypothetical protein